MDQFDSGENVDRPPGRTYLISLLCLICFGTAIGITVTWSHHQQQKAIQVAQIEQQFRVDRDLIVERLRQRLRGLDHQLSSLAANPLTHQYLTETSSETTRTLHNLYLATIKPSTLYRQLCYLNNQSQPLLCVNRGDSYQTGSTQVIDQDDSIPFRAQNHLGTFSDSTTSDQSASLLSSAKSLARGDVEHSFIELSSTDALSRPSFQSATPVYLDGRLNGILVATLDVRYLLRELIESTTFDIRLVEGEQADPSLHNNPASGSSKSSDLPGISGNTSEKPSSIEQNAYRLSLGELLHNDQPLYLLMTPKQTQSPSFSGDAWFKTLMITLIIILAAIPLAWTNSRLPIRLHRDLKKTQAKLLQTDRLLDVNLVISKTDSRGNFTYVSQAFCEISGYTRQELIGQPHCLIRHPDDPSGLYQEIIQTLSAGRRWQGELRHRDKQGNDCWISTTITPDYNRQGMITGYTQISRDISDQKLLQHLSRVDPQTLLINRQHLEVILEQQLNLFLRYPELRFSAILLQFNTAHAPDSLEQEETLTQLGDLLQRHVRKVDLVGRWDDRHFLIICPCTPIDGAASLANKLNVLSNADTQAGYRYDLCIGVVDSQSEDNAELLIGRMNQALSLALDNPDKLFSLAHSDKPVD